MTLYRVELGTRRSADLRSERTEQGFEDFCRREYPPLVGLVTLYCGERSVAEEAVQEALAAVGSRWFPVFGVRDPAAYAYRSALNHSQRLARRSRRRMAAEARYGEEQARRTAARVDAAEDAAVLQGAVSRLTTRQRQALVLRYYADLSVERTAEIMGCRPGTVTALTSQAIAALRVNPALADLRTVSDA